MTPDRLLDLAKSMDVKIVVAESLTGGMLAANLVSVPGASQTFVGGFVAYSHEMKSQTLSVSREILERAGAVNSDVSLQMAIGAVAQLVEAGFDERRILAISTTGVAGPEPSDGQEVGAVYISVVFGDFEHTHACHFEGSREQIRQQTVNSALEFAAQSLFS